LYAFLDLKDVRVNTKSSNGSSGTGSLDDNAVRESFSGELDDVIATLKRSEGVGTGIST
jgi:hypothetical protein